MEETAKNIFKVAIADSAGFINWYSINGVPKCKIESDKDDLNNGKDIITWKVDSLEREYYGVTRHTKFIIDVYVEV